MKIDTLVDDIYDLFRKNVIFPREAVEEFGKNLATKLANRISEERGPPTLRISNIGKPCRRELWYSINASELGEPLPPATRIKFLFGDILEELLLFLARVAGHDVQNEQKEVEIAGVKGHIDGTIDGELVDVKSASTYSYQKFKEHSLEGNDSFGYLTQLDAYGSRAGSGRNHFLAIDKTLGNIVLDSWPQTETDYEQHVAELRNILSSPTPPERGYDDIADGKSGNRKLGVACSYCAFKADCWPGLRPFKYARGVTYLTKVVREPRVDTA